MPQPIIAAPTNIQAMPNVLPDGESESGGDPEEIFITVNEFSTMKQFAAIYSSSTTTMSATTMTTRTTHLNDMHELKLRKRLGGKTRVLETARLREAIVGDGFS